MDCQALMRRIKASAKNSEAPRRLSLRIRRDEVDNLMNSLHLLVNTAQKYRQMRHEYPRNMQSANEKIMDLKVENQRLRVELARLQRQPVAPFNEQFVSDEWQQRTMRDCEQKQAMRGRA